MFVLPRHWSGSGQIDHNISVFISQPNNVGIVNNEKRLGHFVLGPFSTCISVKERNKQTKTKLTKKTPKHKGKIKVKKKLHFLLNIRMVHIQGQ